MIKIFTYKTRRSREIIQLFSSSNRTKLVEKALICSNDDWCSRHSILIVKNEGVANRIEDQEA